MSAPAFAIYVPIRKVGADLSLAWWLIGTDICFGVAQKWSRAVISPAISALATTVPPTRSPAAVTSAAFPTMLNAFQRPILSLNAPRAARLSNTQQSADWRCVARRAPSSHQPACSQSGGGWSHGLLMPAPLRSLANDAEFRLSTSLFWNRSAQRQDPDRPGPDSWPGPGPGLPPTPSPAVADPGLRSLLPQARRRMWGGANRACWDGAAGSAAVKSRKCVQLSAGRGRMYGTDAADCGTAGQRSGLDTGRSTGGSGETVSVPADRNQQDAERVVSEQLRRQRGASASSLDPVGARDSSQRPVVAVTHGSLPLLDELRPAGPSGADMETEGDVSGGSATPSWVGQQGVMAVPCSTVGYGTRAEVVARLPASIMLLRHAECMTLDALQAHERVPNHDIPLSEHGVAQARLLGQRLRSGLQASGMQMYMYTSPFFRCSETSRLLCEELQEGGLVSGVREAVQLREQDWGNFQDPRVQEECKAERLRYGRFYYRFPSGESVADVYDRLTIFQDHLVRDMCAGRFSENTCVTIVSHGLTLRVFAMRWLHWTVRQFLKVYNIPNAEPVMLHKVVYPSYLSGSNASLPFMPHHTKCLYRLTPRALEFLRGADTSMAVANGCWHSATVIPRTAEDISSDFERQWADVDGMV